MNVLSPCAKLLGREHITTTNDDESIKYKYQMLNEFTHSGIEGNMKNTAIVQGGYVAAALEDAAMNGLAENNTFLNAKVYEAKVTYLLPARPISLICEVILRRIGGTVGYVEVLAMQKNNTIATASFTITIKRKETTNVNQFTLNSIKPLPLPRSRNTTDVLQVMKDNENRGTNTLLRDFLGTNMIDIDLVDGIQWMEAKCSNKGCDDTGYLQGGFISAMMDSAMAGLFMCFRRNISTNAPTLEMQTHYFHPVQSETTCLMISKIIDVNNQTAFLEVELYQNDILCAKAGSTIILTYPKL